MNDKRKNILLGVLVVGVISMTVAFAALSTNLRINGTANVAATKWNIHFQEWAKANPQTVDGHSNTAQSPEVNALSMSDNTNVTKVDNVNITLNQPGDTAKYTFQIINEGTIAARLSNFTHGLTPSSNVISEEVKCYSDNTMSGTEMAVNSILQPNAIAYCYMQVKYNDQTNNNGVYHQDAINTTFNASWTWIQDDGNAIAVWDNYISPTQASGGSTLPTGESFWIQQNTSTGVKEVCGVFPSGTVCMTNDPNGRDSEFGTQDENNNYIVTGYTLQKKTEMEQAGASCSVSAYGVECNGSGVLCRVDSNGSVYCRASDYSHNCNISKTGGSSCN